MPASPFQFLRAKPPAPKVALLPDGLFFIRAVDVGAAATPAEVATQVELGLEAISPFPLAQLYYGFFWLPGAPRALAYAAYRRRFAPELVAAWAGAELVLPAFAALLGTAIEPATTLVLASPEGLTAVHWADGLIPAQVRFHPVPPDAPDEDRARARDELIRPWENKAVIELPQPPAPESSGSDQEFVFHAGDLTSRLPAAVADALDVRDKAELAHLRRNRARSIVAWRLLAACFVAMGALLAGEILLAVGGLWQQTRLTQLHVQQPIVDQIMTTQSLAERIDELANKQLLPMEMIGAIVGEKGERKPESITFTRATTSGQNTLSVDAQTDNTGDIEVYENNLKALPACATVKFNPVRQANNLASFNFVVTFKPGALKLAEPPPSS